MLKPSENPTILHPSVNSLTEYVGTWWLAHTKSRFEKAFAKDMLSYGINYFLPMRKKVTYTGRHKHHVLIPLFTSYVFICGSEKDRYRAMTTNRLCRTIEVVDQEGLVRELFSIEKALLTQANISLYDHLPVGSRCRIRSGPLKGIEGVVIEKKGGKTRIVLEITILGQGAMIEIEGSLLERIDVYRKVD